MGFVRLSLASSWARYTPAVKNRPHLRGVAVMGSVLVAALTASPASLAQGRAPIILPQLAPPASAAPAAKSPAPAPPRSPNSARKDATKPSPDPEAAATQRRKQALAGVVMIRRGKSNVALGAALAGDGRILTALSALGDGNDLDAYFADGSHARVKLGHHDRAWDLALLVPQTGRWTHGLQAAVSRGAGDAYAFATVGQKPALTKVVVRGARTLLGGDAQPLADAIELGSNVASSDIGGPILDGDGHVVAVTCRACSPSPGKPCTPVVFGAPMTAVRAFLRTVPASAAVPTPWLGIQGVSDRTDLASGVRVVSIHHGSPAEDAKLRAAAQGAADIILAVDGVPVTTPEALAESLRSHGVGETIPLVVLREGRYESVSVTLRAPVAQPAEPPGRAPVVVPALELE